MTIHIGAEKLEHIQKCSVCKERLRGLKSKDTPKQIVRKVKPKNKFWHQKGYLEPTTRYI